MKNILCSLYGHIIKNNTYGRYWGGTVDGLGTEHLFYKWCCERCGEEISLNVHVPKEVLEDYVKRTRNC
jgi:hypothetical protein